MEHLLCRLHLITSRSLCPVERLVGTLERQVTALAGLKLRVPVETFLSLVQMGLSGLITRH